ncbi:MAG: hypothetical protein HUU56_06270 [Bdellovibrionaceae bacterium]|nr:hypothetical protein [Pseudobdellovibrionaceae bacterium]
MPPFLLWDFYEGLIRLVFLIPSLFFAADYIIQEVQFQGLDWNESSCSIHSYITDYSNGADINVGSTQTINNKLALSALVFEGSVK